MQNFFGLGKYLGSSAALVLVAQPALAQVVPITGVELVPTQQGLELVLEVPSGTQLDVSSSQTGNTFIADIDNTQLILPGGKPFEQVNPVLGVSSVTVIPVSTTQVRVTVVSEQEGLVTTFNQSPQSLVFDVATSPTSDGSPPDETAQTPDGTQNGTESATPEDQTPTPDDASPDANSTDDPSIADELTEEDELEIVVTATRTEEEIVDVPRTVTVIGREEIEKEALFDNDLTKTLGKFAPGVGPPTGDGRTRVFSLRGRPAQILIDGVPQTSNGGFSAELSAIDPAAIEQIEVVGGPSAVFGDGASGGIVNIITRSPLEEDGEKFNLGLTLRPDFEHLSEGGFGFRTDGSAAIKRGKFDFLINSAFEIKGATFDGEGDRIPPTGLSNENRTINVLAKAGLDISENQRLQISYNYFDNFFDSEFISDPIIGTIPGDQEALALRVGDISYGSGNLPSQTIQNFSLTYKHQDVFGSEVNVQGFLRDTFLTQNINDGRTAFPAFLLGNPFLPLVSQTRFDGLEVGGRFQVDTPVTERLSVLWGADLSLEENEQLFLDLDPDAFDDDQEANVLREFNQTPFYRIRNLGTFAQLTWDATDNLSLSGGARYENIRLSVDDYTGSPFANFGFAPPAEVEGGAITVDEVVFNAGIVFKATDQISLYGNFAQGFSIPEVGIALGLADDGTSLNDNLDLEPQLVNNFELGVRGKFDTFTFNLAGFLSTSDLGSVIQVDAFGITELVRAPQRNFGVEFTADWQPTDKWRLGTVLSWNEGDNNPEDDDDDSFIPLSSVEIQPFKATVYVENETLPGWRNRVQALFVGGRERAFNAGVDQFLVSGYTVVDLVSSLKLGPGTLQVGIQNLFDRQFIPVSSQERFGAQEVDRFPGEGRTFSIRYSFEF